MSDSEKHMVYNSYRKSPIGGLLLSWVFPSLGHAYANNWKRGTFFLAGQATSIVGGLYLTTLDCFDEPTSYMAGDCDQIIPYYEVGMSMIFVVAPIIYIWEKVDAYKEVKKYNYRLYKDIFGKEPPSFSLNLQPTYQGANLTLAYKFD